MKIKLVKNGIFPILRQTKKSGESKPMTAYPFSGTMQGEGKLLGIPVLFVRLSGCNLRCSWHTEDGSLDICDTPYSSHHAHESDTLEVEEVAGIIQQNLKGIRHVIISGGEPSLQPQAVSTLAAHLKKMDLHITMETNGVVFHRELTEHIDLFSISPKLSSSTPTAEKIARMKEKIDPSFIAHHQKNRRNIEAIQKYINACYQKESYYNEPGGRLIRRTDKDFQLKFVISQTGDSDEIKKDFLSRLNHYQHEDVVLMPLGSTREFMGKTFAMTARMAVENRWRFTPRTHIDLFDNRQYV